MSNRLFRLLCVAFAGGFVLLLTSHTLASPQFGATANVTYFSQKPHSSSGLRTLITWSDPGEPDGKPKAIKNFSLKFHHGTKFDTGALRACRASDADIRRRGPRACPRGSKLGSGSTEAIDGPAVRFTTVVTLFNASKQIIVLVQVEGRTITEFRDEVKGGTINVNAAIPPGISLTRLDVRIPAHSRRQAKKRRVYMRTPGSCPESGRWTTRITLNYVDGSTQTLLSDTPCSPRSANA